MWKKRNARPSSRPNVYSFGSSRSIKGKAGMRVVPLPALSGTIEGVEHLPDHADVRYMCPEERWNKAILVRSKNTVIAAIIGSRLADKAYSKSLIRFVHLAWFGITIIGWLEIRDIKIEVAPFIHLMIFLAGCVSPIYTMLYSNRFLMLEVLKSFEFLWLMSLNGSSSLMLVYYAKSPSDRLRVAGISLFIFINMTCVLVCDSWNPGFKSSNIMKFNLLYAVVYLTYLIANLRFASVWFAPSVDYVASFNLGRNSVHAAFSPTLFVVRSYSTMVLFFLKFLFSLYMYPGAYIVIKARLYNKKQQLADLKKECADIRQKYRPSRFHNLRQLRIRRETKKESSAKKIKLPK